MKPLLIAAALFAAAGAAQAAQGHAHGVGSLDLAVDGKELALSLELPLDAAVGFERAPKTPAEQAALANAAKLLKDPALFAPTAAAGCTLQRAEVSVPFVGGATAAGDHADIDAAYIFQCTAPAALKGVETTLFKHFHRLYRVEARRAGPAGQGSGRLTPKTPVLSW